MEKDKKNIVELKIDDNDLQLNELGVEIVSFVETPAIEIDWKAFAKQEQFVDKKAGETKDEFIDRCMTKLVGDENYEQDQAYAICINQWEQFDSVETELCDIQYNDEVFTIEQQVKLLQFASTIGEIIEPTDTYLEIKKLDFSLIGDILKSLNVINALTTNQAADAEAEVFYRYSGPVAERNFCRAFQRLNKIYTKNDIDKMVGLNSAFGHRQQPYSIWEFKGGPYCKHYWSKLLVFRGTNNQKVIIDEGPEPGQPGITLNSMPYGGHHPNWVASKAQFSSIDEEKRIVLGPLLIPNKLIERRDKAGNPYWVYFSKETIKKIAEKFFRENKHNNTDINHDEVITNKNTLLESWIVEDTTHDKSYIYGYRLPKGTLMASYKVNDDQTWSLIKENKLNGFSIAGHFIEKYGSKDKDFETLKSIIDLLNEIED